MLCQLQDADAAFIESGGDNLAATFSPELSDRFVIYGTALARTWTPT